MRTSDRTCKIEGKTDVHTLFFKLHPELSTKTATDRVERLQKTEYPHSRAQCSNRSLLRRARVVSVESEMDCVWYHIGAK